MKKEIRSLIDQINEKKPQLRAQIIAAPERAGEADQNTFEISVSSEAPYERWFGIEVLGHKDGEVDMSWLKSGNAPLLLQHDHGRQIGVIDSARLENGRVTAVVRFGSSALAQEIKQDVEDGIRSNVSIGYRVDEMVLTKKGGDQKPDEYRVTKWRGHEASIVSVPADETVGTNRADDPEPKTVQLKENIMDADTIKKLARDLGLNEDASLETVLKAQAEQARREGRTAADNDHKKELARQTSIRELGALHRDRISDIDGRVDAAIREGKTCEAFQRDVLDCYTDGTAKIESAHTYSAQEKKDIAGFSMVKAIREFAAGNLSGVEREVHEQAEIESKASGLAISGFGIPASLMQRDVTVTTEGTDLVDTDQIGFIGLLRNKLMVRELGARMLTGLSSNIKIPRMSAGVASAWEGENDAGSEGTATFNQVSLTPNRVGAYTEVSKQLLLQSTPDIEALLRDDLATSIALAIDYAALHGSGSSNQPTGIASTSGIGSVAGGDNGAAPDWADIVGLETAVAIDNADIGALAYCTNAKVRGKLKQTVKVSSTDSVMVWADGSTPLNGYRCGVSNQVSSALTKGTSSGVCSAIFFGNWNDLLVAQFGGLDIVVDPYSLATTNLMRITANTYADVGVRHAESFAAMLDALTA